MTGDGLFRLDGRVALVTGAAGHLGWAMAEALVGAGARVYLNGRDTSPLEALRERLGAEKGRVDLAVFDVTDESQVEAFVARLGREAGRLDVLLNNAYEGGPGDVETATASEFDAAWRVTVAAAFRLVQRGLGLLEAAAAEAGHASVINVASVYGSVSPDPRIYGKVPPNPPFYGAAKAGLLQLTRYLSCFLAPRRIRVNAISPGPFPRPEVGRGAPEFLRDLEGRVPLGRVGEPRDLQGAALFLASDASAFVTGTELRVDGGFTAW